MTFDKFYNRVVINAHLVAITPLYIGARTDSFKPGEINGSFLKDIYGQPYIPGSSLKGALRAFLSSVECRAFDKDSERQTHTNKVEDTFKQKEDRAKYSSPQELADAIVSASTTVEKLFGTTVMAGKVKIADALPLYEQTSTEVRNGVAIDRDTRTAVGGALFDTEVVPSGTVFKFMASAENLAPDEADMFGKLLEYFAEGNITVGGRSRAGLGLIELTEIYVKAYRMSDNGFPIAVSKTGKCERNEMREEVCKCLQS